MQTCLRFFRYFVFGLFLTCNTVIAIVAVWHLNLLQDAQFPPPSLSLRTNAYLVFVGCAGLALIFPVLFCELAQKNVFLVTVWFECFWVALFCVMLLAGAASSSAAGSDELCSPVWISSSINGSAICALSKVVQAFSWICGMFLLFYIVVFFGTILVRIRDDNTIWYCHVGRFPWARSQQKLDTGLPKPRDHVASKRRSKVSSIGAAISKRLSKVSIIAPRPQNAATDAVRRAAILSYRSGLSGDYTIENFHSAPEVAREGPLPPAPLVISPELPSITTRQATAVTLGNSLYPQHIQSILPVSYDRRSQIQPSPQRSSSPSPIGDWPRLNPPTPRPKRKSTRVSSNMQPESTGQAAPRSESISKPSGSNFIKPPPTSEYASPVLPFPPTSFSSRSRPSGPRQPSMDENRSSRFSGSRYPS